MLRVKLLLPQQRRKNLPKERKPNRKTSFATALAVQPSEGGVRIGLQKQ